MDMEHETSGRGTKKKSKRLNVDRISTVPENITKHILTLMPIRDAVRTSTLSKKWRYTWRSMPKIVFTTNMAEAPFDCGCRQLKRYKLVNAILHVLLLHNGPTILEFDCLVGKSQMVHDFDQIISYLSRGNKVKDLTFTSDFYVYKLPASFFSLQGLKRIKLRNCEFEPPLEFSGFSLLKSMTLISVEVSSQMLHRFISKCPLLEHISLTGYQYDVDFVAEGTKFTFVDLLQSMPLIKALDVSKQYMKYLSAGDMPQKLPTPLVHFKQLLLNVCLMEQDEISSTLCIIRSSPVLEKITIMLYDDDKLPVQQTPTNFLDPKDYSDLRLDHLETLVIQMFSNLPLEIEFVKLIMAKSPMLSKVRIELNPNVTIDEEVKMLRNLIRRPFPRASPSAILVIERPRISI